MLSLGINSSSFLLSAQPDVDRRFFRMVSNIDLSFTAAAPPIAPHNLLFAPQELESD